MQPIPRLPGFDSSIALRADPYRFIGERCREMQTDLFRTRVMLRETVCMTGAAAAELFYDTDRFMRRGAAPEPLRATLLGKGGVQDLDAHTHRHRKRMFMSLMTRARIADLAQTTRDEWHAFAERAAGKPRVVLYDELHEILTRAVCAWAGVPLAEREVGRRTRQLTALFDDAAGPLHLHSRVQRKRAERWIERLVEDIRQGRAGVRPQRAAEAIAMHCELGGRLLTPRIAAVEILNLLRPTVAISVFIVFAAHALHCFPETRRRIAASEPRFAERFVNEVRRYYPFFPAVAARACGDFEWRGYDFTAGTRVLLDLYGTGHDARIWDAPHEFRPDRFAAWDASPFDFIPQGGGDHHVNHRCAGEAITVELTRLSAEFLARELAYDVPDQDLAIDFVRLPALPKSRFVMSNVRLRS